MAGETIITVIGNLTADPELRFTASGVAVASFTIASTPRNYDRESGQWKDGEALFIRCSAWREAAENIAESLTKGMRVLAQGRLQQRSYETREGEKRTSVELQVDEVGPSLRYATAKVTRAGRRDGAGDGGGYGAPAPGGSANSFGPGSASYGGPQGGYNTPGQPGAPMAPGKPAGGATFDRPGGGGAGDPWAAGPPANPDNAFDNEAPF